MASTYHCIECSGIVTNRMHAVSCDGCERWQHRRCNTGITSAEYALMKKGALNIEWHCRRCQTFDHIPSSPPVSPTSVRELSSTLVRSDESESNMNVDVDNNSVTIEDRTFDIGDRDFQRPEEPREESILDPPLDNVVPEDVPTTYEVVESGSKRGGRKLVSSDGYTYTVRRTDGHRTYWTCSKRGKTMKCYASIKQFADTFTPSTNGHQHPADPGALKKVKIAAKVKAVARENVFRPAGDIVESVMKDMITDDDFQLPKPANLTRAANLHRQKLRPAEPTDLNFEIDTSFIGEEFLLDDVRVDDQRHIILTTKEQLHHLSEARRWFVDGTFKIVKRPFYQLLSIHAFVKKEDDAKQVPLVYVLMSRRSKRDYVAVFQSIRSRLQQILVEWFMLDFEAAVQPALLLNWTQNLPEKELQKMKTVRQEVVKEVTKTTTPKINFTIRNVDIPVPGKGQVLLKVKACALSLVKQKILGEVFSDHIPPDYPCGQDVSGVVEKVGDNVTHVRIGDDVVGTLPLDSVHSGCGEYCIFNEYDLVKKPRMLSYTEAAGGIGDCIRAYTALHYQARICAGDTVLILDGASSFGTAAIQIARLWGAKVITTVNSIAEKSYLDGLLPSLGHIIEIGQRSNILMSSVMEETGGLGVDVVIDNGVKMYTNEEDCNLPSERRKFTTPHKHDVISCLGIAGKWVTSQSDLQLDPPDSQLLYLRGASVNFLFDAAWTLSYAQQGRYQHILHDAIDKLDRGNIKCKVVKTVTIDNTPAELAQLEDLRMGKIVMAT